MQFSFTDDQQRFAEAVGSLLADHCPPGRVRSSWDSESDRSLWDQLAEMGVVAMLAPTAVGGLDMTALDLHLVLVETGRCAMPDPVVETAAVAVPLLAGVGHPALAEIVNGAVAVGVAFESDPVARIDVDRLLLQSGDDWHLVDRREVDAVAQRSVDGSRRLATIDWEPGPETLVATESPDAPGAFDRAVVGASAQLLGLGDHLLHQTISYVQDREQFGRPIGSYQAIKHKLTDVLLALDFARPVVARAAYSISTQDSDSAIHASMAKCAAGDAARLAVTHALQCHGAIAYTVEHDLHMWMKRVWALAAQWGDSRWHRRRVAGHLVGQVREG